MDRSVTLQLYRYVHFESALCRQRLFGYVRKRFNAPAAVFRAVGQCTAVYILYFIRILRFVVPELRCVVLVALPLRVFRAVVRYRYVLLPLYADYLLSDFPLEVEALRDIEILRIGHAERHFYSIFAFVALRVDSAVVERKSFQRSLDGALHLDRYSAVAELGRAGCIIVRPAAARSVSVYPTLFVKVGKVALLYRPVYEHVSFGR